MLPDGAKRFYKDAASVDLGGAFGVALDGRAVRTPAGAELRVPGRRLADAIAGEWRAQEEKIVPATMTMMQLACTAIDRVAPNREAIIDQTVAYGGSDLLCYRCDEPVELAERQHETWQPLLDWAEETLSAPLHCVSGIIHHEQPAASLAGLRSVVAEIDDWPLTAVAQFTQVMGSLVLALAVWQGRLTWDAAFEASVIDEVFQVERWGEDRDALLRRKAQQSEVRDAAAFLELL